jgi:hypothetical protein
MFISIYFRSSNLQIKSLVEQGTYGAVGMLADVLPDLRWFDFDRSRINFAFLLKSRCDETLCGNLYEEDDYYTDLF